MGIRPARLAALLLWDLARAVSGRTVSNTVTTTGAISVAAGSTLTLTITATTTDAAAVVFAGTGTANPIGSVSGSIGDAFVIDVPSDVTSVHIDWAGATGSVSFTGI